MQKSNLTEPVISIVCPCYNEEEVIAHFMQAIEPVLDEIEKSYEIIFVNDGSLDDTMDMLLSAKQGNTNVRILNLSRNFGKEAALTAGLDHARGQVIIPIDVDLQGPPALIKKFIEAKRDNKLYKEISLPSVYLKRQRERTRLSGEFSRIFMEIAEEMNLKKRITLRPSKVVSPIIADGRIVNIDKTGEIKCEGSINVELTAVELQHRFDKFIADNCTPYAPVDSSDRMKTALAKFLKLKKYAPQVQRIVLGKENVQAFVDAINLAKERYKKEVVEKLSERREIIHVPIWEVPVIISYNSRYKREEKKKSIMKPFYTKKPSQPEKQFIELLEKSDKVIWWFKNGENEIKYFAVLYKDENGFERAFYVDFILQFKDGSIGLFDTKSGMTAKDAGPRAEGLQKYIKEQNKKGKILWGGIAIFVNGTWRYNDNEKYEYNPNDLSSWKVLEIWLLLA